jgi:hypothetical protein
MTIARCARHLDLFTVGADNHVYSAWWDAARDGTDGFQSEPSVPPGSARFTGSTCSQQPQMGGLCRRGGMPVPAGRRQGFQRYRSSSSKNGLDFRFLDHSKNRFSVDDDSFKTGFPFLIGRMKIRWAVQFSLLKVQLDG